MALGQFALALPDKAILLSETHALYLGLALIIAGNGLFKNPTFLLWLETCITKAITDETALLPFSIWASI
jgi:dipeptide/tripeptide permease